MVSEETLAQRSEPGMLSQSVEDVIRENLLVAHAALEQHAAETTTTTSSSSSSCNSNSNRRAPPVLVVSLGCYGTCVPGRAQTANREGESG